MKNVLIVSNGSFYGGAEQFICNTLVHLEAFYNVSYLVSNTVLYEKLRGKQVFRFSSSNLWKQYLELKKIAKSKSIDLLLYNGGSIFYFSFLLSHYKQILYRHSTDESAPVNRRLFYKILMNSIYCMVDLTIHVSRYSLKQQLLNRKKALCIHSGIFLGSKERKHPINCPPRFLYCGRLEYSKGVVSVVSAFRRIPPTVAELHIIGDGSLKEFVCQNVRDNIKYYGFRKDVDQFYEESDALILMSSIENFPLSILEAMSKSLPILASNVGGIPEMVNNNLNGLIINANEESIFEAVTTLSCKKELMAQMGEISREICEKEFNAKNKIVDIHGAIDNVLNE